MPRDKKFDFLIETYKDCRTEIEQRISQRDNFTNQLVVTLGVVLSLGVMNFKYSAYLLLLLPFLSLFYTIQILYSYSIHDRLHAYLSDQIEPAIAKKLHIPRHEIGRYLWENYCRIDSNLKSIKTPGIRKNFYIYVSYVFPFLSGFLFFLINSERTQAVFFSAIFAVSFSVLTFVFVLIVFSAFNRNNHKNYKYIKKKCPCDYLNAKYAKDAGKMRAVFLDRDGTIHIDKVQTHLVEDLEFFDDTIESLKKLYQMGFLIVIVTNQDGIKNKKYKKDEMTKFNAKIREELEKNGIEIAAIYYSPHNKKENHISFKPNSGMLIRASYDLNISLADSYMIGDQVHDIIAGEKVGVEGLMVATGIYAPDYHMNPDYLKINPKTFLNLTQATSYIVQKELLRYEENCDFSSYVDGKF